MYIWNKVYTYKDTSKQWWKSMSRIAEICTKICTLINLFHLANNQGILDQEGFNSEYFEEPAEKRQLERTA